MQSKSPKTALVIIDSYNDFMSKKGGAWRLINAVGKKNNFLNHMERILTAARKAEYIIAFSPHHRYRENSFRDRNYLHPANFQQLKTKSFSADGFGGEFYEGLKPHSGEIISSEHSCSSGFAETDLHEKLTAQGISHLVLTGCISNSCVEATARSAVDLGYHVSIVTDAISAFSPKEHAHALNNTLPLIAHELLTTENFLENL